MFFQSRNKSQHYLQSLCAANTGHQNCNLQPKARGHRRAEQNNQFASWLHPLLSDEANSLTSLTFHAVIWEGLSLPPGVVTGINEMLCIK